jgi:hypothetical protein
MRCGVRGVPRAFAALLAQTGQHDDDSAFAQSHVGILAVNHGITRVYFHLVGAGRDVQDLWMIVARRRLSGLCAIHEHERSDRSAGDDDLGRVRQRRFARTEPTAGG